MCHFELPTTQKLPQYKHTRFFAKGTLKVSRKNVKNVKHVKNEKNEKNVKHVR